MKGRWRGREYIERGGGCDGVGRVEKGVGEREIMGEE